MRALALASWWQLRNALRTTLTEPRKLVPLLIVTGLMSLNAFSLLFVSAGDHHQTVPIVSAFVESHAGAARAIVFAFLVLASIALIESGLTGRALTFQLADIDFIFPAPVTRRVVLAFRVPAIVLRNLFQASILLFVAYFSVWRLAEAKHVASGSAPVLLLSVAGWITGYTCIAITLEIALGLGRSQLARRISWACVVAVMAAIMYLFWQGGLDGIAALERSWLLALPFYPCRLLTDAFLSPMTGLRAGGSAAQLALFAAAAAAVLLSRRENYYETALPGSERAARIREAARQGNLAAVLAQRAREMQPRSGESAPGFRMPAFGRGAVAIFWAHLAAASKRPFVNFIGPLLGGAAVSTLALTWSPRAALPLIVAAEFYYVQFVLVFAFSSTFRQAVGRRSLIGPLPVKVGKIVAAEITPTALTASWFGWGAVPSLAVHGGRDYTIAALELGVVLPVALCAFCCVQYTVALWYPSGADKVQQILGGFVGMALLGLTGLVLAPFIGAPIAFRLSPAFCLAAGVAGSAVAAFVVWRYACGVYRRTELM